MIIKLTVSDFWPAQRIVIGCVGENSFRVIEIDASDWSARGEAQGAQAQSEAAAVRSAASAGHAAGSAQLAEDEALAAAASADAAANNVLNGVSAHNQNEAAHADIRDDIIRAEAIARGRALSLAFDTVEQLDKWIAGLFERDDGMTADDLQTGDNLYIRDLNVPDYWWDGTERQVLEAESPALAGYYTKLQVQMLLPVPISRADYESLYAAGQIQTDRFYDIIEDEGL